jgi:hypothetical protein
MVNSFPAYYVANNNNNGEPYYYASLAQYTFTKQQFWCSCQWKLMS